MKVKLANGGEVTGDFVVYAIGLKRKKVLNETIQLKPIMDHNGLFPISDKGTVLGVQSDDGTFIGIGTGAEFAHPDVTPDMINVGKTLPEGVPEHSMTANRLKMEAALAGGRSDASECDYTLDNINKIVADIVSKYDCIEGHKLSAEEKNKYGLQRFNYLSEALGARIFESRKEPDSRHYSSKEGDLLPPGPEHGAAIPNRKAFKDYWKKQLEALDDRLYKRKHQFEQLKKYVDSVKKLEALDPDTRKQFEQFEQIWSKKIDSWKLLRSDPDTRDLYEPKLQDTEKTIKELRNTIELHLKFTETRLDKIVGEKSASMEEVRYLHMAIWASRRKCKSGLDIGHSLPLPWELKKKVASGMLVEPFQELESAFRGLHAGLEQAFPDWSLNAPFLGEDRRDKLSEVKEPADNLEKLIEQWQTIRKKWEAAYKSLEDTAKIRNHLLRASDEELLKFIQKWEASSAPIDYTKYSLNSLL